MIPTSTPSYVRCSPSTATSRSPSTHGSPSRCRSACRVSPPGSHWSIWRTSGERRTGAPSSRGSCPTASTKPSPRTRARRSARTELIDRIHTQWAEPDGQGGFAGTPYVYGLCWLEHGRYLTGFTRRVRAGELARVTSRHVVRPGGRTRTGRPAVPRTAVGRGDRRLVGRAAGRPALDAHRLPHRGRRAMERLAGPYGGEWAGPGRADLAVIRLAGLRAAPGVHRTLERRRDRPLARRRHSHRRPERVHPRST